MSNTVQIKVQELLIAYWTKKYEAYLKGEESVEVFLEDALIDRALELPNMVRQAVDYYYEHIEKRDIGVVRLYQLTVEGSSVYLVRTTTDGDDGWIELFDATGEPFGTGRTYIEQVAWGENAELRAQAITGAFPTYLDTQATLWK